MRPRWWSCSTPTGALPTQSPNPAPALCSPARLRVESGGTSLAVAPPASCVCVCVGRRLTSPPPLSHHLSRDAHATLLETGFPLDVVGMPLPEVPHTHRLACHAPARVLRECACAPSPLLGGRSGEIGGDLGRSGEMDCSGDGGACSCIPTSSREDTDSAAFSHTVAIVNGRWPMYARHEAGFTS